MASRVSVIVPTYNCAAYIREALESVLAQTYRDFEVIVVDDGSADDTQAVLAPFGTRITYVPQENRGAAAARNTGIRLAKGDLVAFLDADDLWMPLFLEREVGALGRFPHAALAFAEGYQIDHGGQIWRSTLPTAPEAFWGWIRDLGNPSVGAVEGQMYKELLMRNFIRAPSAVTVRKACLERTAGFDEKLAGEDYSLWLQLARRHTFVFVNMPLYKYRMRPDSKSGDGAVREDRWEKWAVEVLERELGHVPPELRRMLRRRIAASYWRLGWRQFHRNQLQGARPMFRRCLHYEKPHWRAWAYAAASFLPGKGVEAIRGIRRWRRGVLSRLSRSSGTSGCWPRSW